MTEPPRCQECRRPMRRPSPDRLGPVCRTKLAAKRGLAVSPLSISRHPYALVEGQISLFELEDQ